MPVRFFRAAGSCALVLALMLGACSRASEPKRTSVKPDNERRPAPDFTLRDSEGKLVRLSDYKGKVVLLNFWATWCNPCRIEIPWFIDFERQHKDRGFAVLGVSMDEEGWEPVKQFVTEAGINYRIALGDDKVAQLYGGLDSLPTTFMIDRDGRIASIHIGLVSRARYENDVKELLSARAGAASRTGASACRNSIRNYVKELS